MTDSDLQMQVLDRICRLTRKGRQIVIVHGGGPFINEAFEQHGITSTFIDGHRVTSPEAYALVEHTLKERVNTRLVNLINQLGFKAIGLSGQDGPIATATPRKHDIMEGGRRIRANLGQVGDVGKVDAGPLWRFLKDGFIPVVTCVADGPDGRGYNINGDMFAGHLAGALGASHFVILTDVDGLYRDIRKPESLIRQLTPGQLVQLRADGIIAGGMIPKLEACTIALEKGAGSAVILNGTKPESISNFFKGKDEGTLLSAH